MNKVTISIIAGLAGGVAWIAAMLAFFGPAQSILLDPALQSAKFLTVVGDTEHPARMAGNIWVLVLGLMVIGQIHSAVFAWIGHSLPGRAAWHRGLAFGLIAWALSFPWFEFYLPWNMMLEPAALVGLELLCWLGVMLAVGVSISIVQTVLSRARPASSMLDGPQ